MAFVSGLMGPDMSPIPINASTGMLISLGVALMFAPWLCRKLLGGSHVPATEHAPTPPLLPLFKRTVGPFLAGAVGRRRRHRLYWAILAAIFLAVGPAPQPAARGDRGGSSCPRRIVTARVLALSAGPATVPRRAS